VCRGNITMRLAESELEAHPRWRDVARDGAHPPLRGWLAAPLTGANDTNLGLVELSDRYEGDFTSDDEAILTQLAEIGSAVLAKAQLLHKQTQVALTLQRSILGPAQLPAEFAVRYEPAADTPEVGGDWYDVVTRSGTRYGVVVGDVVGRGLDAASVMGQLRSAARALLLENNTPAQALTALDTFTALIPDAHCSTVFCAIIEPAASRITYSSAGHPPAILVDAGGSHRILEQAQSLPLAVRDRLHRPETRADLPPGSTLLLYTDGLVERRQESLDVGIARAVDTLTAGRHQAPEKLADGSGRPSPPPRPSTTPSGST
jgi:serine phosphatase RsbU (regulator of sigma subunit)